MREPSAQPSMHEVGLFYQWHTATSPPPPHYGGRALLETTLECELSRQFLVVWDVNCTKASGYQVETKLPHTTWNPLRHQSDRHRFRENGTIGPTRVLLRIRSLEFMRPTRTLSYSVFTISLRRRPSKQACYGMGETHIVKKLCFEKV